jgi:hypothetical protein
MKAPFPATRPLRKKLLCTMVQVVQLPVLAVFVPALLKKMMNAWIFEAWRNDHPTPFPLDPMDRRTAIRFR